MTGIELNWLETGLLLLTPALVLAAAVLIGRYPGERLLARPRPRRPRRRRSARVRLTWAAPVLRVGGGLLLGHSLAGRAPPAAP